MGSIAVSGCITDEPRGRVYFNIYYIMVHHKSTLGQMKKIQACVVMTKKEKYLSVRVDSYSFHPLITIFTTRLSMRRLLIVDRYLDKDVSSGDSEKLSPAALQETYLPLTELLSHTSSNMCHFHTESGNWWSFVKPRRLGSTVTFYLSMVVVSDSESSCTTQWQVV